MQSPFPSTAEQVVAAVEATAVNGRPTSAQFVADFANMTLDRAEAALALATELRLLSTTGADYEVASPFARFFAAAFEQRSAAALRLSLESYAPFTEFRSRLLTASTAADAAHQVNVKLQLGAHRDEIRDTLVSLGTYAQSLQAVGSGHYEIPAGNSELAAVAALTSACNDIAAAESRVRGALGEVAADNASDQEVIGPLADALLRAGREDASGAVQQAGNAAEAYLVDLAARRSVGLSGANGINAKVERFVQQAQLPDKIRQASRYVGHIRNAADHGIDQEVGASWGITPATGIQYVLVCCSLLRSLAAWETGANPTL